MLWTDARLQEHGLQPPERRVRLPDAPQHVADVLNAALAAQPNAIAIVGRSGRLTFREVDTRVNAAAAFLQALGVREGDRVAACAPNDLTIVLAFLATQRIGAIWVGVNRNYGLGEKRHLLADSEASCFLADADTIAEIREAALNLPSLTHLIELSEHRDSAWARGVEMHAGAAHPNVEIDPWAPAAIAYTSGTTGLPKGAVHSQHNMLVAATLAEHMAGDRRPDVIRATASPLTILNMMILGPVATLSRGSRQVLMDRTDALGVSEWIAQEKVNTTSLVPTIVQDLLTRPDIPPERLESLTWIVAGAAMVPERVGALYRERFGKTLTIGYGLTENPTAVSRTHEGTPQTQGAVGRPLPHLTVSIQTDEGRHVAAGEIGEICVRAAETGPWAHVYTPTLGYWRRHAETTALLRDGWLHTGDVGRLDEVGELYIVDRRRDLIVRGGANVYPAEVERVLRQNGDVSDCAVVGLPDERLGQIVAAVVELREGAHAADVQVALEQLCAAEIARFKIPVAWRFAPLPRNVMGKTLKADLPKLFLEDAGG